MKKKLLFLFLAFAGLLFNSCKSSNSDKINLEITSPKITEISLNEENESFLSSPDNVYIYNIPSEQIHLKSGEDINGYVTITPNLRGHWSLENDKPDFYKMVFIPEKDWLPNKKYKVTINKKIFKNPEKVTSFNLNFSTKENGINVQDFYLWHDEQNLDLFGIKATVKFDFPVEEPEISLKNDKTELKPEITFDKHKRYCFINYQPITLTDKKQTVKLKVLNKEQTLTIPESGKFFKLEETQTDILGKDNDAVQAIIMEFTDFVSAQEVEKNIDVYLLPKNIDWNIKSLEDAEKILKDCEKVKVQALPQDASEKIVALKYDKPLYDRYLYIELKNTTKSKSGHLLNETEKLFQPN